MQRGRRWPTARRKPRKRVVRASLPWAEAWGSEPRDASNGRRAQKLPKLWSLAVGPARIGLWSRAVELMSLVLLGCRVTGPAALSSPAARRADRAREAWQAGLCERILACGGKAWGGVREADAFAAYLIERGVPANAIERELRSRSTRQNARYAAKLLLPRGVRRVGIVTCDWHMARALRCFRGAGFDAVPVPALSPPTRFRERLVRRVRERVSFELDRLLTLGFSRI